MMSSSPVPNEELLGILLDRLDVTTAQGLEKKLGEIGRRTPVLDLLMELGGVSSKVQGEAVKALGEVSRGSCLSSVVPWLDLGITFAQASGALGLRYFKESPMILNFLTDDRQRDELLTHVLELADGPSDVAPQCAYEWFKVIPQLSQEVSSSDIQRWAQIGMELSEWNYVLGNEFFRECPAIAQAIPLASAKSWVGFGMKLVVTNQFGKPDYMGTLEFFRSSPSLFSTITEDDVKQRAIEAGATLADHSPEHAMAFLADIPAILGGLPSNTWRLRVLKYGLLVVDQDPVTALAYFRRVGEVVALHGASDDTEVFDAWFAQGMEALEYSPDAGQAFFLLETRQACSAVEQAMSGISLRQVARTLKMFARALCGEDFNFEPLPQAGMTSGTPSAGEGTGRAQVSTDGKTIYLPLMMQRSATREGNRRWYTIMVAHEVGHVEFGTYRLSDTVLQDLAFRVETRYHPSQGGSARPVQSLGELFQRYPQPNIIRDLWEIIEDGRIDCRLRHEYPGLGEDLTILVKEAIQIRTLSHGMTAREMVLDALLLHFAGLTKEDVTRPGLQEVIDDVWAMAQTILCPTATVDDAVQLADRLYQELECRIGKLVQEPEEPSPTPTSVDDPEARDHHEGTEHLEEEYQPLKNFEYRGVMNPDHIQGDGQGDSSPQPGVSAFQQGDLSGMIGGDSANTQAQTSSFPSGKTPDSQQPIFGENPMQQWFQPQDFLGKRRTGRSLEKGEFVYEEWDGTVRDYRPRWCRVIEQPGVDGSPDFVDETFQTYGPIVRLIRRYFEAIRPEAFRRIGRQSDGEDIDLDALISWMVDRRQGNDPSDQIYSTRQKRDRQVAVAFLIDMSGSTGRQIGERARPVIEVEKEGLLLLSEALSAIGDQYAMYGFSGQTRQSVNVHILKDFQERSGGRVGLKISGIKPRQQNRDGAAIRHATTRLMQQAAKVRLLILISDGRPLDDHYADEYSLEDTKMALREARLQGVHPFCITIDQGASDYVKRMYGEVGYLVVDEVDSLPTRLPKVYQRLTSR